MKKDDGLLGNNKEEEDLFDLSLDDLEPEDTVVETHDNGPDEEIIELIDLVEKGEIGFIEEEKDQGTLIETIQEFASNEGDDLKIDKSLDLLDIPLDQPLESDRLDEFKIEDAGIDALPISDSGIFMEKEPLQPSDIVIEDIVGKPDVAEIIPDETVPLKEGQKIEEALSEMAIEDLEGPKTIPPEEQTIKIYKSDSISPEPVSEITKEELREALYAADEEPVEEKPRYEEYESSPEEEAPRIPSTEAVSTVISEEKIEAVLRKVVEEVLEKAVRETMTGVAERVARETMTNVAEKLINDAINSLKHSIESVSGS